MAGLLAGIAAAYLANLATSQVLAAAYPNGTGGSDIAWVSVQVLSLVFAITVLTGGALMFRHRTRWLGAGLALGALPGIMWVLMWLSLVLLAAGV